MSVRSQLGKLRRGMLASINRRTVVFQPHEAIVSFTFDDFPRSAYTAGGAVLEEHGVRGTYYAAAGLMNSNNELGEQFGPDDLNALLEKGHELGSHTFGHISSRSVSCSEFCADIEKGRRALQQLTGMDAVNFAYPFGDATLKAKNTVEAVVASARGISPGLNDTELDLNHLRANRLYGDLDQAQLARNLIAANAEQKDGSFSTPTTSAPILRVSAVPQRC